MQTYARNAEKEETDNAHLGANRAAPRTPKRLIVCADGTWNDEDAAGAPTNVAKLHRALQTYYVEGVDQWVYYHSGVGTRWAERIPGGAFGVGIDQNIRDCYEFLVENYAPGDELYFFGFSRGAYTVRSLAGLIRNSGIVREKSQIDAAFKLYRSRRDTNAPDKPNAIEFRDKHAHPVRHSHPALQSEAYRNSPEIKFIGVWDTVGALGYPLPFLPVLKPLLSLIGWNWWFHDTDLSTCVRYAYHAIAMHERRSDFKPTLWTQRLEHGTPLRADQVLEQVYFPGVHCDVGGGYGGAALSDIAYCWMIAKARDAGLAFRSEDLDAGIRFAPDPLGRLHESFNGLFLVFDALRFRFHGRPRKFESDAIYHATIADSAVERARRMKETTWPRYGGSDSFASRIAALVPPGSTAQPRPAAVLKMLRVAPAAPGSGQEGVGVDGFAT